VKKMSSGSALSHMSTTIHIPNFGNLRASSRGVVCHICRHDTHTALPAKAPPFSTKVRFYLGPTPKCNSQLLNFSTQVRNLEVIFFSISDGTLKTTSTITSSYGNSAKPAPGAGQVRQITRICSSNALSPRSLAWIVEQYRNQDFKFSVMTLQRTLKLSSSSLSK
jgi:hypothetical protein